MEIGNKTPNLLSHLILRITVATGILALLLGGAGWLLAGASAFAVVAGIGAVVLIGALLYALGSLIAVLRSRRGAMGVNTALQVILAFSLLVGINLFSYLHHIRWDLTRDGVFTVDYEGDIDLRDQLSRLEDETLIVMHLTHRTYAKGESKLDSYDAAAEKRVMAKVRDLVEQFQELGPRFKVVALDVQDLDYKNQLEALTQDAEPLRKAIEASIENSVFFYSRGQVQRLSFTDIYQLDKVASKEGKGNLVLHYQGEAAFARRIVHLGAQKPRIGVVVIHPDLGMHGSMDDLSMAAARKALEARGFETKDIITRKWGDFDFGPTVRTHDEYAFEELEEQIKLLEEEIGDRKKLVAALEKDCKYWEEASLKDLNAKFAVLLQPVGPRLVRPQLVERKEVDRIKKILASQPSSGIRIVDIDDDLRKFFLEPDQQRLERERIVLTEVEKELEAQRKKKDSMRIDDYQELRRITDLEAKMDRLLQDVDLLILPRMTLYNVASGRPYIAPNPIHLLDPAQFRAIKRYIASGKPALFCLGPENIDDDTRLSLQRQPFPKQDRIKGMLEELGFALPAQTILFDVESKSFARRRAGVILLDSLVKPPPVDFEWPPEAASVLKAGKAIAQEKAGVEWRHPIHASVRLAARSVGGEAERSVRLRHPRPVWFLPKDFLAEKLTREPIFMMTGPEAWNETNPFPDKDYTPRFDVPKSKGNDTATTDPRKLVEEERHGRQPIAAAAEVPIPNSWPNVKPRTKARIAIIGHGAVFSGDSLTPVQERLLLDTCNWLLGRDDLLSRERPDLTWKYPRVSMSEGERNLWTWGACFGMPLLIGWIGTVVLFVRRIR